VATAYLARQGILEHTPQARVVLAGSVCNACACPTGLVLVGAVRQSALPTLQVLGFTKF